MILNPYNIYRAWNKGKRPYLVWRGWQLTITFSSSVEKLRERFRGGKRGEWHIKCLLK